MNGDNFADRARCGRAGFDSRFDGGNGAPMKTATFPEPTFSQPMSSTFAGLEHRVRRFELRHEAFGFDHSKCLISHSS